MKHLYLTICFILALLPTKLYAFTELTEELSLQNLKESEHIFEGCVRSEEIYIKNTDKRIPDIVGDSRAIKVEVSKVFKGRFQKGNVLDIIIAGSGAISLNYNSKLDECRIFLINEKEDGSLNIGLRSSQHLIKEHLHKLKK